MIYTRTALLAATRQVLAGAGETQYTDDTLTECLNWGLNDLVAYCPDVSTVDYDDEVDGVTTTFTLPDNIYRIDLVHVTNTGYVEEYDAKPGVGLPSSNAQVAYRRHGSNLVFNTAPDYAVTVYYDAYYDELVEGGSVDIPRWAKEALAHYAASSALAGKSAGAAAIDQWDQAWDGGNPEHNPLARVSEQFYLRYLQVVLTHTQKHEIQTWRPS